MKILRCALVGILPTFVLLVGIQLNASASSSPPPSAKQSWLTSDDAVHTIWHHAGTLYDGTTYDTAKLGNRFNLRQLAFEDRVSYQRTIEAVYWGHRIWPKARPDSKPSLDAVMSQATIEKKVRDYLRQSELLEKEWQKPITSEQLQTEMERIAAHTMQPEVLRELFAALDNDPFVIAECLARPVLVERSANGDAVVAESAQSATRMGVPPAHPLGIPVTMAANGNYTLPAISDGPNGCIDDTWTSTSLTNAPAVRYGHTAVWTGSEMIVWGGKSTFGGWEFLLNTGGRYLPSTDSWTPTTTNNAPAARYIHTAVWTGSEMIVWGGSDGTNDLNTGGRYTPTIDSWAATSTTNAPTARTGHTVVWSGREMIVYGGGQYLNTGGRYNPDTDTWRATTTTNSPAARVGPTAVWAEHEMIIWGGTGCGGSCDLNTGGRYNPRNDSWTATSIINAPTARHGQTAVWTDTEMIVWAGSDFNANDLNTGGKYNLITNSWAATSTTNAPKARRFHKAMWSGSEMIVWGGETPAFSITGGRYNPTTDHWTATSIINAPTARQDNTAVWSGSEMLVWGGCSDGFCDASLNTGGRYCAQAGPITLDAHVHRQGDERAVALTWSPADGGSIKVLRDGNVIATTDDDGTAKDNLGTQTGTFTYHVCETDSGDCSNLARVTVRGTDD